MLTASLNLQFTLWNPPELIYFRRRGNRGIWIELGKQLDQSISPPFSKEPPCPAQTYQHLCTVRIIQACRASGGRNFYLGPTETPGLDEAIGPSIMRGKIILEEHVAMPEDNAAEKMKLLCRNSNGLATALLDLHGGRLKEMNDNGVEMAIMSQNGPGPQGIREVNAAEAYAVRSNDYIAKLVDQAPERFAAFASVSMHDPKNAAAELTRCVTDLGMVGVMLNDAQEFIDVDGSVSEHFYDIASYDVFWKTVESLEVPVYLHPKPPRPSQFQCLYKQRPWLIGPTYSFAADCGFHALALCTGGLFDRFPKAKLILGHMGMFLLVLFLSTEVYTTVCQWHKVNLAKRGNHPRSTRAYRALAGKTRSWTTSSHGKASTGVHGDQYLHNDGRVLFHSSPPERHGRAWRG